MLPPNTNTKPVFLIPHIPFRLASFNVHALMQIGQQIGLVTSLEDLDIDICCLSETHIQNSSEVLQIRSRSIASKSMFHLRLSGNPMTSSGFVNVGVALGTRA
ncbi:unnamed protein product [Schistosoma mattheei]|uniref:Uncharacterized protein n=1 Tax=Schistosoma mattheei TaxID=31246 RepID=A0AA85BSE5_9TREM|nr:unnamed protein product [Schistosoma mattheei]